MVGSGCPQNRRNYPVRWNDWLARRFHHISKTMCSADGMKNTPSSNRSWYGIETPAYTRREIGGSRKESRVDDKPRVANSHQIACIGLRSAGPSAITQNQILHPARSAKRIITPATNSLKCSLQKLPVRAGSIAPAHRRRPRKVKYPRTGAWQRRRYLLIRLIRKG